MLNGEPIGYAQSFALGSGDGWWEEETDRVRGIDQSLANASQLGKGLGTKLVQLWLSCCSIRSPRSKRTRRRATRAIRSTKKAGFEREGTVTTPDGPAVYMVQTRQTFERTRRCCLTLPSRDVKAGASRPSCQTLNIMREAVIAEVSTQLSEVVGVIERHLEPTLLAVHFVRLRRWRPEATVILICWLR